MSNREELIEYLQKNGRNDLTWDQIADKFSIQSGEAARSIWKRHRANTSVIPGVPDADVIASSPRVIREDRSEPTKPMVDFERDFKSGGATLSYRGDVEIKSKEDLVKECNIDLDEWEIVKMRHNYWAGKYQVRVDLEPRKTELDFQNTFIEFLDAYKHKAPVVNKMKTKMVGTKSCLVFNKQDAHLNKFDVNGKNDIEERFEMIEDRVVKILKKASITSDLQDIVYILGSDQFNSEWNGFTTKGTPQENILPFHESFQLICDHEVRIINYLLQNCDHLHIAYVSGNHDEYVGWHMMQWLKAYFRNQPNLTIDSSPGYRKYVKFSNTAMMFNHGDVMKPTKLAQLFPVEYSKEWSTCDNYYIFTGDKHREINADFNGIKFYGIPALSTAKSRWDEKNGYVGTRAEMTAFLVEEENGLTDIYKAQL